MRSKQAQCFNHSCVRLGHVVFIKLLKLKGNVLIYALFCTCIALQSLHIVLPFLAILIKCPDKWLPNVVTSS